MNEGNYCLMAAVYDAMMSFQSLQVGESNSSKRCDNSDAAEASTSGNLICCQSAGSDGTLVNMPHVVVWILSDPPTAPPL